MLKELMTHPWVILVLFASLGLIKLWPGLKKGVKTAKKPFVAKEPAVTRDADVPVGYEAAFSVMPATKKAQ